MEKITGLSIDIETYSDVDLPKCGVYRYVESDAFDILLFAVSVNGGGVQVYDLACGDVIPDQILTALTDSSVIKHAFNASFERICISEWLRRKHPEHFKGYSTPDDPDVKYLDPSSWRCSMIHAAYLGLPHSLDGAAKFLNLHEQKMSEGKSLICYFCQPCRPTKKNGGRTRNLPEHDPEKWELFKEYNKRDVEAEAALCSRFAKYPVPSSVWDEYSLDQVINDRGIMLDSTLVDNAVALDDAIKTDLIDDLKELTGIENPNSVKQMKEWLAGNGVVTQPLAKDAVSKLIDDTSGKVKEVLQLYSQLSRTSVSKYAAMQNAVCQDGRARGMFQFYGASRTGRWSGRLIQLQNLPKNEMLDLADARALLRSGDFEMMQLLYDNIPDTLSQLIRTAFIPRPGYKFIAADFSAIEARVLAHLAGEEWRSKVFAEGGDIYCASASMMFGVPVEKHGANSRLRQKGKIAELALGYGGSVGALQSMGAEKMGIPEDELQPLVDAWRNANPNITEFWQEVDRAVKTAIMHQTVAAVQGIRFRAKNGMLFILLPSGRHLSYAKPGIGENRFGGSSITYEGVGATKKWGRIESYGAKFVENIVQAISRDILSCAMQALKDYAIVGHVHDELIIECRQDVDPASICRQMSVSPSWMPDLLLDADGFETMFYKKD